MPTQQRLIVCLDGTWNQQDSSTNVLHHFNLVREGAIPGTNIIQKRYYHPGVGTGVLDRITGGGFGFGLENNVRDAYNWLVQNYCDGKGDDPSDEIYIFGFSRGAYTARSLVGFIGQCGLLRRGAPITVDQLWQDYCILGRRNEQRTSVWDKLFWKPEPSTRPITDLVRDPWLRANSGITVKSADLLDAREQLLIRWSRRVRITYLGVYDTVGAIGWDALAIPGLTSRLAVVNNMRPTTIIQRCRHALAIDEHRSSFNHTPFLAFVGHDAGEQEEERGTGDSSYSANESAKQHWDSTRAMWNRKIEQRWFVGAHSNIGGGYEDNRLAETPLRWLLDGATEAGLVGESVLYDSPVTAAEQLPRDSFAEFASPVWTKVLRAKPNYRLIDPDPLPRASAKKPAASGSPAGFSLQTINENLDASVAAYWGKADLPLPPNLFEYARRRGQNVAGKNPEHSWLDQNISDCVALLLWATLAAAGLAPFYRLTELNPSDFSRLLTASLVAFILPLLDWGESAINFRIAMGKGSARSRAFRDAIYWTRASGFVLFLCGAVYSAGYLWQLGWRRNWGDIVTFAGFYSAVPVIAAVSIILMKRFRSKPAWLSILLGPIAVLVASGLLIAIAWFTRHLFNFEMPPSPLSSLPIAGWLLLLQLGFVSLWRSLIWTREPLSKANLGSITLLQRCFTPAQVKACLDGWRNMLVCRWRDEDEFTGPAAKRMREVVREALWRDILGLIPVYTGFSVLGLWFAATYGRLSIFGLLSRGPIALWLLIPLVAAAANYLEDATHLRYLNLHENGTQPSSLLTLFSGATLVIKAVALVVALVLSSAAIVDGTFQVWSHATDWRAKIAILMSLAFAFVILLYVAGRVIHRFAPKAKPRRKGVSELVKSASTG